VKEKKQKRSLKIKFQDTFPINNINFSFLLSFSFLNFESQFNVIFLITKKKRKKEKKIKRKKKNSI